jgi:hypothetical protein
VIKPAVIMSMVAISTVGISAIAISPVDTFMFETFVVKTSMVEISGMISFEERAIMGEVETIPIVAVPGRIIIIGISGKISFADGRGGIVSIRSIGVSVYDRSRSCDINPGYGQAEANTGADKDLRITGSSNEAGGYNGGENK